jgi:hypothetical protein
MQKEGVLSHKPASEIGDNPPALNITRNNGYCNQDSAQKQFPRGH